MYLAIIMTGDLNQGSFLLKILYGDRRLALLEYLFNVYTRFRGINPIKQNI